MTALTRHLINIILYYLPPTRLFVFRRFCLRLASVDLGKDVCFCGRSWIYGKGNISIGQNTWISPGVVIHTHTEADIIIGERCDIGPSVEIITGTHQIGGNSRRAGIGAANPVKIGNGSWVGAKTLILGGVSVGEGVIISAGSVVTKSTPDNVLVAGVPAHVISTLR